MTKQKRACAASVGFIVVATAVFVVSEIHYTGRIEKKVQRTNSLRMRWKTTARNMQRCQEDYEAVKRTREACFRFSPIGKGLELESMVRLEHAALSIIEAAGFCGVLEPREIAPLKNSVRLPATYEEVWPIVETYLERCEAGFNAMTDSVHQAKATIGSLRSARSRFRIAAILFQVLGVALGFGGVFLGEKDRNQSGPTKRF